MSLRSAVIPLGLTVFLTGIQGGCTHEKPPAPGAVIVSSDHPPDTKTGMLETPIDGQYACYQVGFGDALGTFTVKKGELLGFETVHSDEGRGRSVPTLYGVAGSERIMLPLGDKYVWKLLP
jgi:hypothetical protein